MALTVNVNSKTYQAKEMQKCRWCHIDIFKKQPNPFGTTNEQVVPLFKWWHLSNRQSLVSVACNNNDPNSHVAEPEGDQ